MCANLRNSSLKNVNCEDPMSHVTNMEGVNLKCANLEGSQLAHVNLRVATLKNAVLCNCDLRAAILAGADLEGECVSGCDTCFILLQLDCDLSGSDLHEANLRGANLKGNVIATRCCKVMTLRIFRRHVRVDDDAAAHGASHRSIGQVLLHNLMA